MRHRLQCVTESHEVRGFVNEHRHGDEGGSVVTSVTAT